VRVSEGGECECQGTNRCGQRGHSGFLRIETAARLLFYPCNVNCGVISRNENGAKKK
jgi:hypothetical protein